MIVNSRMEQYLSHLLDEQTNQMNISIDQAEIQNLVTPYFFEWDQCVLLKQSSVEELPVSFVPNSYLLDRTAFEAYYNHIHLNDCINSTSGSYHLLQTAIEIIEIWKITLFNQFKNRKRFIIILSYDGEDCVLRFHTLREEERSWLNVDSLESYAEGIMMIEV